MAVQVGSLTVIDDTRNLTNILNATNTNTANAFVKRDAQGSFSAGIVTATFSGNITGNVTGNLNGDVTKSTSNGFGTRTVSTLTPSGGVDGDIWYQY